MILYINLLGVIFLDYLLNNNVLRVMGLFLIKIDFIMIMIIFV